MPPPWESVADLLPLALALRIANLRCLHRDVPSGGRIGAVRGASDGAAIGKIVGAQTGGRSMAL